METLHILIIVGVLALILLLFAIGLILYVMIKEYLNLKYNFIQSRPSGGIAGKSSGHSSATISQFPTSLDTQ